MTWRARSRRTTLRSLCRALLFLDVAYGVAALAMPALPGWKMFESSRHVDYALRDGKGQDVDVYAWAPRAARDLDDADVVRVAQWICATHRAPAPLRLDTAQAHVIFDAPDCEAHEAK